ncbi:DegV family protein [Cellulomonas fimi]|uniref:DegV family protein n=1 Tax=Cellulomonas fimi TaxID=1708 RepID=A0A7Y0LW52_CELFI|nr:DegV family protein [Cellulomonas fimi]
MLDRLRPPARPARVALVTDSTASLPPGLAERWGITVVPLGVTLDGAERHEGVDLRPADLLAVLTAGRRVTTSQPPPAAFARAYAQAAARGAREIVSVHLSGDLSGTVRSAQVGALAAPVPVHVVDARSVGMGLGFAVVAAAEVVADPRASAAGVDPVVGGRGGGRGTLFERLPPADGATVAERARRVAAGSSVTFLVDSLDHLRRGGRLGAGAAALGTVLGLRPLLGVRGGRVEVLEKVRTRRAARERLEALVLADVAARGLGRVAVHHLGQPDVAAQVGDRLQRALGAAVEDVVVSEASAVIAAHAGPGLLAVVVAPR